MRGVPLVKVPQGTVGFTKMDSSLRHAGALPRAYTFFLSFFHHVLMSCSGYADIRAKYGLNKSNDMQSMMRCGDQVKIVKCLREIWARRATHADG